MGKSVEESKNEMRANDMDASKKNTVSTKNTVNANANTNTKANMNTSTSANEKNINKNTISESKNKSNGNISNKGGKDNTVNTKKEVAQEIKFVKPVDGEISKQYAKENLLYSETLEEWTTHLGIDIKADKATVVKAAADGKVKSIKNDPRYGLTIIIEHQDGYQTLYANLLTSEFVRSW